jgi:PAS domain S-box-containing protein
MSNETSEINQQRQQLRDSAEAQLDRAEPIALPVTETTATLLHELRVHQIELEMQNEELRRAKDALEESRDRYVDLYEFAPVGYLTLTLDGTIAEMNLTAATLFGVERLKLARQRFVNYISVEDRDRWHRHFLTIKQGGKQSCELRLLRTDGSSLHAHIECLRMEMEVDDVRRPLLRLTITDITARKQAEDDLRDSETHLNLALEGANAGTWDWNLKTGHVIFNERWATIHGYSLEEVKPHVDFWRQSVFPDDLPRIKHLLEKHLQGHTPFYTADYRIINKSGELIWTMVHGKVVERDTDGKPLRVAGITRDISPRKQMEEALRTSEANLAAILEGSELSTWDCNLQTGVCSFDARWAELCGYTPEEIEPNSRFWKQSVFPNDFPEVQKKLDAHLDCDTPFFTAEYRIRSKSGALFWVMDRGKVIERDTDGKPLRMTGITMNITQRKQMEQRLRIAAAAFETQAGIIITDEQKYIISANQAFTDITGYVAKEIIGHSASFLNSGLHDEDFFNKLWAAIARDGFWQGEIWDKRKNGEVFPVWLTITTVIDNDNLITHYVGSFTDISAQKQAERVLLEARERLEHQVATTQEELEKIRDESTRINATLNILLKHRETDKCDAQNALSREVEGTVLPFLKRLKGASKDKNQTRLIHILEDNLQQLVKFYGRDTSLSSVYQKLTPAEIQIASMVRQGLSTKLIATVLCLSPGTVGIHRKHIRKKLDLDSKEINLYSYLMSLSE